MICVRACWARARGSWGGIEGSLVALVVSFLLNKLGSSSVHTVHLLASALVVPHSLRVDERLPDEEARSSKDNRCLGLSSEVVFSSDLVVMESPILSMAGDIPHVIRQHQWVNQN